MIIALFNMILGILLCYFGTNLMQKFSWILPSTILGVYLLYFIISMKD